MKKLTFILGASVLLFSCQTDPSNNANATGVNDEVKSEDSQSEIKEEKTEKDDKVDVFTKAQEFQLSSMPDGIKFKGDEFYHALKWEDKTGKNVLVLSTKFNYKTNSGYNSDLFAELFVKNGNSYNLVWTITDYARNCDEIIDDEYVQFGYGAPEVTDLNNDGYAEVWVSYRAHCGFSDKRTAKVIMYENDKKFAARGVYRHETLVSETEQYISKEEINFDDAFKHAPENFREQVKAMWKRMTFQYFPGAA